MTTVRLLLPVGQIPPRVNANLMTRHKVFVNTDPQRRCYNGCFISYRYDWSTWSVLEYNVRPESQEARIKFWRELNEYAVSQRGDSAAAGFEFKDIT